MKMDEMPGTSAFYKDKSGDVFHTYSTYSRGIDLLNTTYNFLDLTAKGAMRILTARKTGCVTMTNTRNDAVPVRFLAGRKWCAGLAMTRQAVGEISMPIPRLDFSKGRRMMLLLHGWKTPWQRIGSRHKIIEHESRIKTKIRF